MNDMVLQQKPKKLVPVLIGGFAMAVISSIPIINFVNCLCCAGIMGGAILGVWFYKKSFPQDMIFVTGDGAGIGALAGIVGGIVTTLFTAASLGFFSSNFSAQFQTQFQEAIDKAQYSGDPATMEQAQEVLTQLAQNPSLLFLIALVATIVVFVTFGTLGGLIGGSIFKTRIVQPLPPFQQNQPPVS